MSEPPLPRLPEGKLASRRDFRGQTPYPAAAAGPVHADVSLAQRRQPTDEVLDRCLAGYARPCVASVLASQRFSSLASSRHLCADSALCVTNTTPPSC
jgi:hypothetical protein